MRQSPRCFFRLFRWRSFFYSTDVLDIGIDSVSQRAGDGESAMTVALHRMTTVVFPVSLRVAYADGTVQDFRLPRRDLGEIKPFRRGAAVAREGDRGAVVARPIGS